MFSLLLALTLPILQAQPVGRQLSTRWHPTVAIETGLSNLAFVTICPAKDDSSGHLFAVDSAGHIAELAFEEREWKVRSRFAVGEPVTTGCAASTHADDIWSLIVGAASGKVIELRRGEMGWGRHEITTAAAPLRSVRSSEPSKLGPSQLFVIDAKNEITNWYVGVSGRWYSKPLAGTEGGATHVCFDETRAGLRAIVAGSKGIIYQFIQDSMGDWSGTPWDTLSSPCLDLASAADPSMKGLCLFYAGEDGHLRYLFKGRQDDVTSRLPCAYGAHRLIGKGDQRRFNEFFGMAGDEFCLFEYDSGQKDWIKVPIRGIPSRVISTTFGPARSAYAWHTIYAATVNGKIYEFERDGLENE